MEAGLLEIGALLKSLFGKKQGPVGPPTLAEQLKESRAAELVQKHQSVKQDTREEAAQAAKRMSEIIAMGQKGVRRPARGRTGPRGSL